MPSFIEKGGLDVNDWKQWSIHVLATIEKQEKSLNDVLERLGTIDKQVSNLILKVTLLSSGISVVAYTLLQYILDKIIKI